VLAELGARDSEGYALAVQRDGKPIADGLSSGQLRTGFVLIRFTAAGRLDPSFGQAGKVTTDFGANGGAAFALALPPDGKMVVAGVARLSSPGTCSR
jgi:hypothetical protein